MPLSSASASVGAPCARAYKNPLRRSILLGCLACIVVLCVVLALISFVIFNRSMMAQYKAHIGGVMHLTLSRIDVADLERCMAAREESAGFRELLRFMDDVRQHYKLDYLVIVQPQKDGDRYDVMQVASGLLPEERAGARQKEFPVPLLGDMMGSFYPEGFIPVIYNDMLTRRDIKFCTSATTFGRTYDGAVPIRNARGEGVALLTAGLTLRDIDATMRRYLLVTLASAVVLGALFLAFMVLWLRRRVITPLTKIEAAAADFAEKSRGAPDPAALVLSRPDIHTDDELEALSDTIVVMSGTMKDYVERLLASAVEIRDMQQKVSKMNDLAFRDALTGVKNKAAYEKAKQRLDWDIVNQIAAFGILMVDLNYLKRVNDTYGHEKGDCYLRNMCAMICDVFAHSPVFRIGGDEFLVLLENRDLETSGALVEALSARVAALQADRALEAWERVSAAVGLAVYDSALDDTADAVFKRADKAMYEHKKAMKAVRVD